MSTQQLTSEALEEDDYQKEFENSLINKIQNAWKNHKETKLARLHLSPLLQNIKEEEKLVKENNEFVNYKAEQIQNAWKKAQRNKT